MTTPVNTLENIPSNLYKPTAPWTAEVLQVKRMTADHSENDVKHIVLNLKGSDYHYIEGQSLGVLPPGTDAATGKPHKLRLYSIASPRVGDDGNGETVTVCVKRVEYQNEQGETVRGVCSNYLCDLKVGDQVQVTGPVGKAFLPPSHPNPNLIMIATGTGIAPFRAFLHWRFVQNPNMKGQTMLFFGVQKQADMLYGAEMNQYARDNLSFQFYTCRSREEQNAEGKRMYVQHRIAERAQAVLDVLLQTNTYLYICGLKGMEDGILEVLKAACDERGISWEELYAKMNAEKRWMVEVY